MDPRIERLAKVLIHYSLKLKKGQTFRIQGGLAGLPLIKAAYKEAVKVGAHPYVKLRIEDNEEAFYKYASDEQLKFISPMDKYEIEKMDALLNVWASENTRFLNGVDHKRQALCQKARKSLGDRMFKLIGDKKISWVGTQFPTLADAQEADMSLSDYEDFVYSAGHVSGTADPVKHWRKVHKEQDRLIKKLDKVDLIHIQAKDTDLTLRVKGRKWINCAGTENFPDGEVFTSPLDKSADGYIRYSFPAIYGGREVDDVRLEFKNGKVVKATAGKNQEFLISMLDMDPGARYLGEFAIGTNYEIKQYSKNILFDEKIGGTCHLAVGAAIPEAGGKNKSSLHWDMVCNLKKNATITADGKVIYKNGKFTI